MTLDRRPRRSILLLLPLALGCAHSYTVESRSGNGPATRLGEGATIYVAQPNDGQFGGRIYFGSGAMTTQELVAALSLHAKQVEAASSPASRDAAIAATRAMELRYLLSPTILHWEERATEWSGKPDRITVELELIDADSGEVVDTTRVSGKSRWATLGGDHPQELLPEPFGRYARALFGVDPNPKTSQ